jgi:hypothetical protein
VLSVLISGKVCWSHGKKDILAALHRSGRADGLLSSALVEPGAHIAAAGPLLVGGVSQRMVLVEKELPPKSFHPLQREQKSRYSHSYLTFVAA